LDFKELTEEELGALQFESGRTRNGKKPYDDFLAAVKTGKKMLVKMAEGQALKNLKWGLSQAAKKAEIKLDIKVLTDKTGVVVSCPDAAQPSQAETGESNPEAPVA
jgi:hypothetical protein